MGCCDGGGPFGRAWSRRGKGLQPVGKIGAGRFFFKWIEEKISGKHEDLHAVSRACVSRKMHDGHGPVGIVGAIVACFTYR